MVLVIPVSQVDINRAEKLLKRIVSLSMGAFPIPPLIVVALSWQASFDAHKLEQILPDAWYYKIPTEEEIGWPEAPNHMFYNTALFMANTHPLHAWYFMEADTYPLVANWWWALKEEYEDAGKPYMGIINDTRRIVDGKSKITGKHMTGTAIYPSDFLSRCRSVHYLMHDPWDYEIADEVVPYCHHTKLIAHRWGSSGYYLKDGMINITESRSPVPAYVKPIPPEAVVVHGCKDDSIYELDSQPVAE